MTLTTIRSKILETAWLIERRFDSGLCYWGHEEGELGWTHDHMMARRYASKADAETEADSMGLDDWSVYEHAWQ